MGSGISSNLSEYKESLRYHYGKTDHLSNAERMQSLAEHLKSKMKSKYIEEEREKQEAIIREEKERALAEKEEMYLLQVVEMKKKAQEARKNPRRNRRKAGQTGLGGSWNRVGLKAMPRPRSMENVTVLKNSTSNYKSHLDDQVCKSLDDLGQSVHTPIENEIYDTTLINRRLH